MDKTNKTFFTLYFGQAVSQLTSSMLQMAIVWYLIAQGASAMIIALSGIMAFLPQGILGLFVGVYIDRHSRKAIMIVSDLLIAAASLVLVISGFFGKPSTVLILVVLAIRSVGTAFHQPSLGAVIPLLVPKEQLSKYAGYAQGLQSISLLLSPAISAVLFAVWDLSWIILLDVIGAAVAVLCVCLISIPKVIQAHAETTTVRHDFTEGFAVLKRHHLAKFTMAGALFSLTYLPIFVLYPMMTLNYFDKTQWHAGFVEIIFALGMLVGAFSLSRITINSKVRGVAVSVFVMAISLILSGFLPAANGFVGFLLLSALLGVATPFYQGLVATVYGERIPETHLGRVLSFSGALAVIGTPVGIAISGVLADSIGVQNCFAALGGLLILVAIVYALTGRENKS